MSAPIPLVDAVLMVSCPACNGSGCRPCNGTGKVHLDPYRTNGGEQAEDFGPSPFWVPLNAKLARAAELARTLRDPSNSAPLTELLDLIEGLA